MHNLTIDHMNGLKRILWYIKRTLDFFDFHLYKSSVSSLIFYTNVDWDRCPDIKCLMSKYCVFLGDNLIFWSSKRQLIFSKSNDEAEYRGVSNVVSESCWIRNLLLK